MGTGYGENKGWYLLSAIQILPVHSKVDFPAAKLITSSATPDNSVLRDMGNDK
jgi:hypothetical protein